MCCLCKGDPSVKLTWFESISLSQCSKLTWFLKSMSHLGNGLTDFCEVYSLLISSVVYKPHALVLDAH